MRSAALLQGVQQRDDDARARAADGMPQRDSAAVDVQPVIVHAEFAVEKHAVDGECLVVLEEIEVA